MNLRQQIRERSDQKKAYLRRHALARSYYGHNFCQARGEDGAAHHRPKDDLHYARGKYLQVVNLTLRETTVMRDESDKNLIQSVCRYYGNKLGREFEVEAAGENILITRVK